MIFKINISTYLMKVIQYYLKCLHHSATILYYDIYNLNFRRLDKSLHSRICFHNQDEILYDLYITCMSRRKNFPQHSMIITLLNSCHVNLYNTCQQTKNIPNNIFDVSISVRIFATCTGCNFAAFPMLRTFHIISKLLLLLCYYCNF